MDWTRQFDGYCERIDLGYWSEPLNAATNLAFLIAAVLMSARVGRNLTAQALCMILFAIGVGSALFHIFATVWASLADTAPIGLFILVYLFAINRDAVGLPTWAAVLATLGFMPYAYLAVPILDRIPFVGISNFYWTVPILLVIYGVMLRHRLPTLARGLITGAVLQSVSISLRSLDETLCPIWPYGTHFVWHCLNAVMLAYMIHIYHSHVLAGAGRGR